MTTETSKATTCPPGAIVGETIKPSPDETGHCVVYFDRPGRVEISSDKDGMLVIHAYDGTGVDLEQPPVGGFLFDANNRVVERWVSGQEGKRGQVDHDFEEGD